MIDYATYRAVQFSRAAAGYDQDRSRNIGRLFMRPTKIHFTGWTRPVALDGFVPRMIAGYQALGIPSAGSLDRYFTVRERRQAKEHRL